MTLMLPLGPVLRTRRNDLAARALADRHYSRKTPGARDFAGPGRLLILRNPEGTWLFIWRYCLHRMDHQTGWECSLFRNESERLSSEIILDCEARLRDLHGTCRMFTYVDPGKVRSTNPGFCFLRAGWKREGFSKGGHGRSRLMLLTKEAAC